MPKIKTQNLICHRLNTSRSIEDWRTENHKSVTSRWAVHCVSHSERTYYSTFRDAADVAQMPLSCPQCQAFDLRCVHCQSDLERWKKDPETGFTPSIGQIFGRPVCGYHQFGALPERVSYVEHPGQCNRPIIDIYLGSPTAGTRAYSLQFHNEPDGFRACFFLGKPHLNWPELVELKRATEFAISALFSLNFKLHPTERLLPVFETWEESDERSRQAREARNI